LGLDHQRTKQLAVVRKRLDQLDAKKDGLESQLRVIKSNMPGGKGKPRKDFSALQEFFPDTNIRELTDVETFHARINGFLSADIQEEINILQPQLDDVNGEIAELDKQIEESGIARDLSQRILNNYARVAREITDLEQKNRELETEIEAIKRRQELDELLGTLRRKQNEVLANAETKVNDEMTRINAIVTDGDRPAPVLTIKPEKTFEFGTPDDKSEGTAFKNLVVYDLSMLALTPVPALIHDSSIVKRIEDADFEQILGLYQDAAKDGRQVFIAFDKADTYTPETSKVLEDAAILHLGVGKELFGTSWSRNRSKEQAEPEFDVESEPDAEEASDTDTQNSTDEE
jgi:uncharacterized protein YydD (DUF2326 family)